MARRILVVDDEEPVRDLVAEMLSAEGYEVDCAASAHAALDRIRETIYDGAIVDFNLPDMDGVLLHRRIRQMDSDLAGRTLFVSGMAQTDANLGYYAAQGGGFLSKPFERRSLVDALAALIDGADRSSDG